MALLKERTFRNGIKAEYHMISDLSKSGENLNIEVATYVDEEHREIEKNPQSVEDTAMVVYAKRYVLESPKDFSYEEAYEYLKTLDEFEGAKDI